MVGTYFVASFPKLEEADGDSLSPVALLPSNSIAISHFSKSEGAEVRVMVGKKSVSFNDECLVEVIEFEDDEVSKEGRKLFWEFAAVDRYRFKDRVQRMELILNPVLAGAHRKEVYLERMANHSPSSHQASFPQSNVCELTPVPGLCHQKVVEMEVEITTTVEGISGAGKYEQTEVKMERTVTITETTSSPNLVVINQRKYR